MSSSKQLINVLILQRAIPHYRVPLFKALCQMQDLHVEIGVGAHDIQTSSGLAVEDYCGIAIKWMKVYKLPFQFLFQSIISLKPYDVISTDMSVNVLSVPFYLLISKITGKKIIGWGKGVQQNFNGKENKFKKAYKKWLASQFDALIVYGAVSKRYFVEMGIDAKKIFIAQNTVDTDVLLQNFNENEKSAKHFRAELGIEDRFVFGYFGKLVDRKQVDKIINAFDIIFRKYPQSFLLIAGIGPERENLELLGKDLIDQHALKFLGKIPIGKEGEILHAMDVFLSYSQAGLGILEAMATQRVIVSTPEVFPETELLENGFNCIFSQDFTIESYVSAMEKAILEKNMTQLLAAHARQTVEEKATISIMTQGFCNAITSVLGKTR
jgi:glycosyltransferase involved in cell wall biosynthesis